MEEYSSRLVAAYCTGLLEVWECKAAVMSAFHTAVSLGWVNLVGFSNVNAEGGQNAISALFCFE